MDPSALTKAEVSIEESKDQFHRFNSSLALDGLIDTKKIASNSSYTHQVDNFQDSSIKKLDHEI